MAVLLASILPPDISLVVIEDEQNSDIEPAGHAITIDCESIFHKMIGLSDLELILSCDGNLSLGTQFSGWQGDESHFLSAPSGKLPGINGVAFHHIVLRAAMARGEPEKLPEIFSSFRFAAQAASAGKLTHGSSDPQSPRTMLRPRMSLDAGLYTRLLKEKALAAMTFEHHQAQITGIKTAHDSDHIRQVVLSSGQQLEANLFVDVSGALASKSSDDHSVSILPFDRMISGQSQRSDKDYHPVPIARALSDEVVFETALRNSDCKTLVYDSTRLNDQQARARFGDQGASLLLSHLSQHRILKPWSANIVRAGLAAGSLGPHLSADIRLLHQQAITLSGLIPISENMNVEADEYNRLNAIAFDQLRDFYLLPFVLNKRPDDLWRKMRDVDLPESMQIRLAQFESRGRFVTFDGEAFEEQEWVDMMIGFGRIPGRHDPMAQTIDMAQVGQSLGRMVDAFKQTIDAMPTHRAYMDQLVTVATKDQQSGNSTS